MEPSTSTTPAHSRTVSDSVMIALRKIIQAIDMNSKQLVKRVGLTGPQLVILQEISSLGEVTAGEIAQAVSLSQATVTGILERMENRGLLTRQRSDQDKRRIMVRITESGKQVLDYAPPLMQEAFVETVYESSGMGADHDFEFPAAPGLHHGRQSDSGGTLSGDQSDRQPDR